MNLQLLCSQRTSSSLKLPAAVVQYADMWVKDFRRTDALHKILKCKCCSYKNYYLEARFTVNSSLSEMEKSVFVV